MFAIQSQFASRILVRATLALLCALLLASLLWTRWVYGEIRHYAELDQAAPADAIAVFGAAEYDGKPSPVYRARLNHALSLYRRNIAPLIIPVGGSGGDQYSEGGVGRQYLMSMSVPESAIIAETYSTNTADSTRQIAVIARANNLRRLVIVSDGTHLFRIHELARAEGLDVLTSPRPRPANLGFNAEFQRVSHEILSYTAWRLHLR